MESAPISTPAAITPEPTGKRRNWAQIIIAAGVLLYFCNEMELVLVVLLTSVLLAFILAPIAQFLERFRLPRSLASIVPVFLLMAVVVGITYLSYNQAASFVHNLPQYSGKIREEMARLRQKAERIESRIEGTPEEHTPSTTRTQGNIFNVRGSNWTELLTRGFGSFSSALLAASFVPFLVYFMLSWQQHARSATVMLFPLEDRHTAYVTLGLIASMMRSFMVGNLLIGIFMSAVGTLVFGLLHLPFFYFVGPISGFLSLIPYLGVVLALAPPLLVGIGQVDSGDAAVIVVTVLALHLFSLNVLYPKFLGSRVQLNPLAVTISLLFWGWLWGAMGLVLAVPVTGAMKIIFDHIQPLKPYGVWLGE
jgi:predicted PurR-regulated permease PerM